MFTNPLSFLILKQLISNQMDLLSYTSTKICYSSPHNSYNCPYKKAKQWNEIIGASLQTSNDSDSTHSPLLRW